MDNVIQNIRIEDIVPNNYQHQYDMKEIEELAASIKKHGLLEPITLRKKDNKYELILGNKRYKACIIAGLKTIPSIIKTIDDTKAKEYFQISNNTLILSDISNSNLKKQNLDVINLSELNREYERDEFKMNNNQFDNNIQQQPMNNPQTEPTFGGRFFPSLEDEPTNMNFGANQAPTQMPVMPEAPQPQNNNFIDLTDLNIGVQSSPLPNEAQVSSVEPMMAQTNLNNEMPMANNNVQQMNQIPTNGNIINLDNLKQNAEMGTQPISNVDNNFQEVINDFSPNNNEVIPQFDPPQMSNNMEPINQPIAPMQNMDPITPQNYELNQEVITNQIPEPMALNNMAPNISNPMQPNLGIESQMPMDYPGQNEFNNQINNSKDLTPVINTIKALAINLENFGYTIRITDEDLSNSYKINIEIDK